MPKARVWRSRGEVKKRTAAKAATLSSDAMPTKQRLEKGAFEIGGVGPHRVVRMLDAPLEQALAREQITETQFQVLARYRMHWFLGHHSGNLRAIDLDRVMVSGQVDRGGGQGIWHSQMYLVANGSMRNLEREVTTMVAIEECSVTEVGSCLGYRSPYRGREAVLEILRSASKKITSAWLTMDRT